MGEIIKIDEYLERKAASTPEHVKKRLAEIAVEQALLEAEKQRLLSLSDPDIS